MGKRYGIVSYNHYVNFVNFGSVLQSWALQQALDRLGVDNVIVDYCPRCMMSANKDNPLPLMQEADELSRECCRLSMGDIRRANRKFDAFWDSKCRKTDEYFDADSLDKLERMELDGYICGSDTIWDIHEFPGFHGFDDGYFAHAPGMRDKHNIAYSASIGDCKFSEKEKVELSKHLKNFRAVALREKSGTGMFSELWGGDVACTIDPTLLLEAEDYMTLEKESLLRPEEPYLLLYSRRYNPAMEAYADRLAEEKGLKVVEISLRAVNGDRHIMAYDTGIEEFLFLTHQAACIVTNSFHGAIFAMQYRRPFHAFFRQGTTSKTQFLLDRFGLSDRCVSGQEFLGDSVDWESAWKRIREEREASLAYLRGALEL